MFLSRVLGALALPHGGGGGVTVPEDVARWETNRVHTEWLRAWRQRRRDLSTARVVARAWGQDTDSEPESSGGDDEEGDEDGEDGEVTPPPHSP
jgi:hypothetical protein